MSHWDFGRPPAEHHDASDPSGPDEAASPSGLFADGEWWPDAGGDWWPADGDPAGPSGRAYPAGDGGAPPADGGWPVDEDAAWPTGNFAEWPPAGRREPAMRDQETDWPGGDDGDDGDDEDELGPYPLTFERDQADATAPDPEPDASTPAAGARQPWRPAPRPDALDGGAVDGPAARRAAATQAPSWSAADGTAPDPDSPDPSAWAMAAGAAEPGTEEWADWDLEGPGRVHGRGGRRWLIPAGIAVAAAAVGAGAVLLTGSHPGGQPAGRPGQGAGTAAASPATSHPAGAPSSAAGRPASAPPSAAGQATGTASGGAAGAPLTLAQAHGVLATYTAANNSANAQRSDTRLAAIETGSSLAIDTALYRAGRAAGTPPFPAFSPAKATYYIPATEPATGPRWFVVQVANAFQSNPGKVSSTEFLLFTQPAPGGPWQDAIEPYLLPGAGAPRVALDASGQATAVALDAATDAVSPGQLPVATAASLDAPGGGQAGIAAPAGLTDLGDQRFWRSRLPGGQVTDTHAAASGANGQVFALRTADGGALVFYTDTARLTVTPPAGNMLHLTIPGFYAPSQALSQAALGYLDQFAAYDPPAGGGAPRIVADYAAMTGTG